MWFGFLEVNWWDKDKLAQKYMTFFFFSTVITAHHQKTVSSHFSMLHSQAALVFNRGTDPPHINISVWWQVNNILKELRVFMLVFQYETKCNLAQKADHRGF